MRLQDSLYAKAQRLANEKRETFVLAVYDRFDDRAMGIFPMSEVDTDEWDALDPEIIEVVDPARKEG